MANSQSAHKPALSSLWQQCHVVDIPTTTSFRGIKRREALLFSGPHGWSEFSPFLEYEDGEAAAWLKAAVTAAFKPSLPILRESVAVNATMPIVPVDRVPEILNGFSGAKTIKFKVDNYEQAAPIIARALELVPGAKVRIDVNGGWELIQALAELRKFNDAYKIDYVEQPCAATDDLKSLAQSIDVPIAVDESIRKNLSGDLSRLKEFASVAIIKWQPSGGSQAALALAEAIDLPVVISSALETGIGIGRGVRLACAIPNLYGACGLGTVSLLAGDIAEKSWQISEGKLENSIDQIDERKVSEYRANNERAAFWQNRAERIWQNYGDLSWLN